LPTLGRPTMPMERDTPYDATGRFLSEGRVTVGP
jgi:hypothetical protein